MVAFLFAIIYIVTALALSNKNIVEDGAETFTTMTTIMMMATTAEKVKFSFFLSVFLFFPSGHHDSSDSS